MIRLVQLRNGRLRRVGVIRDSRIWLLDRFNSTYALAQAAVLAGTTIDQLVKLHQTDEVLDYDSIYRAHSEWRLAVPIDHPDDPARCLVSGTGLTHLGSAKDRNAMHEVKDAQLTDSMKMFRWGVEAGKPEGGKIGVAPEWFYKGSGTILRAHGEALEIPAYAEDGGEEGEITGVYLISPDGRPFRIGMAIGNEFSDHRFEKRNYLNLAGSKIRTCAIGPELIVNPTFRSVPGKVRIERGGTELWSKDILSGEAEMCHSLQNLEHHHFKFETHRRPGDLHIHYFGACSLSFGAGIQLQDGDVMEIQFEGFGRPLRNPVKAAQESAALVTAHPLC